MFVFSRSRGCLSLLKHMSSLPECLTQGFVLLIFTASFHLLGHEHKLVKIDYSVSVFVIFLERFLDLLVRRIIADGSDNCTKFVVVDRAIGVSIKELKRCLHDFHFSLRKKHLLAFRCHRSLHTTPVDISQIYRLRGRC